MRRLAIYSGHSLLCCVSCGRWSSVRHPLLKIHVCAGWLGADCTEMTYKCADGTCIKKSNPECDFVTDCPDASDERHCGEASIERTSMSSSEALTEVPRPEVLPTCKKLISFQTVGSHTFQAVWWAGSIPARGSGHGRRACS